MWVFVYGWSSHYEDLGNVAEQCPHCRDVVPCTVIRQITEVHIFFIPIARNPSGDTCSCRACGGQFPVEQERYRSFVSLVEALTMPIEQLVEQTNPPLIDQLQWAERRQRFAADSEFTAIADVADQLGPGRLQEPLLQGLQRWQQLDSPQRAALLKSADNLARVLAFVRSLAAQVPQPTGCLAGSLVCLLAWGTVVGLLAAGQRFLGPATGFVGLVAGPLLGLGMVQWLRWRRFRRWTIEVMLPEAEKFGIAFADLAAVLQDLPASRPSADADDQRALREHAEILVRLLHASEKNEKQRAGSH